MTISTDIYQTSFKVSSNASEHVQQQGVFNNNRSSNIGSVYFFENALNDELLKSQVEWERELQAKLRLVLSSTQFSKEDIAAAMREFIKRHFKFRNSHKNYQSFTATYLNYTRKDFLPAIAIDYDGEISLEWYGMIDDVASLTFTENGYMRYILFMQGEVTNSHLKCDTSNIFKVLSNLETMYKNKIAYFKL